MTVSSEINTAALITAAVASGQGMLIALVPMILAHAPVSIFELGCAVAAGTFALMLSAPIWGHYADRFGPRSTLPLALGGYLAVQILFALFLWRVFTGDWNPGEALAGLCLLRVLHGITAAGIHPACQQWAVASAAPSRALGALARISAGANLGRGLGPLVVLLFLPLGDFLPLAGLVMVPAAALVLLLMQRPAPRRAPAQLDAAVEGMNGVLLSGMAIAAACAVVIGQTQYLLGPLLEWRESLGGLPLAAHTGPAALILALATSVALGVQLLLGRGWGRPGPALAIGAAALLLAGLALQTATTVTAIALCLCGMAAGMALVAPSCLALVLARRPDNQRARITAGFAVAYTGGYSLAFVTAGIGFATWNWLPLPGVAGGLILLITLTTYFLLSSGRPDAAGAYSLSSTRTSET